MFSYHIGEVIQADFVSLPASDEANVVTADEGNRIFPVHASAKNRNKGYIDENLLTLCWCVLPLKQKTNQTGDTFYK